MDNQAYISMFTYMPEQHKKLIAEMIQHIRQEDRERYEAELVSFKNLVFQDKDLEARFFAIQEENESLKHKLSVIRSALEEIDQCPTG